MSDTYSTAPGRRYRIEDDSDWRWARVVTALAGSTGCGKPEVAIRWADEITAAYRARFGKAPR